jgi:hypothetical protein
MDWRALSCNFKSPTKRLAGGLYHVILKLLLLLRKRGIIESVFSKLKTGFAIEHSRHRSFDNFIIQILGCFCAYYFEPKKPSIFKNNNLKLTVA